MRKDDFIELSAIFDGIKDGSTVVLKENAVYDVWQDNCYRVYGYHCSNTATYEENPTGERPTAIFVKGKQNVVIDGNGATIRCHGILTPIVIDGCENITFKNLTVDYARPTMSETYIKSYKDGVYTLEFSPETLFETEGTTLYFVGENNREGTPFFKFPYKGITMLSMWLKDRKLCMLKGSEGDVRPSFPTFESLKRTGERTIEVTLKDGDSLPVGATIQTRCIIRDQLGGLFERCENVVLSDCRMLAMHGFGLMFQFVKNVKVNRLYCKPVSGRTSVSNADFLQFMNCGGKVIVNCSEFEGAHDDFINVHGTYLKAIQTSSDKCIARFMHPQSRGFRAYETGDEIAFVDADKLETYKKCIIKEYRKISDTDTEVVFAEDIGEIRENTFFENLTWSPEVEITNNYFGYNACRGILCSTPGKTLIKGNVFDGNSMCALLCSGGIDEWYESGVCKDLEFSDNKIRNGLYGCWEEGSAAVKINDLKDARENTVNTKRFVFRNNEFTKCSVKNYSLIVKHVSDFIDKDNYFDKPAEEIFE